MPPLPGKDQAFCQSQVVQEPSVDSCGDSYDNALAETINGLYKAELIQRRTPWKNREFMKLATLE